MAKANAKLVPCLAQYHIPGGLWLGLSCTGLLGDDFSTVQPESVTEGSALCSLSAADLHRIAIQAADVYQAPQQNALPEALQHCCAQQPAGEAAELK